MQKFLCSFNQKWLNIGLLILRIGIGIVFTTHGFEKIMGGISTWTFLGLQMKLLGINIIPIFWGLSATVAEFAGGVLLILGLFTRIAAFFLMCVMVVALVMHIHANDPFLLYSHALSMLVVFLSLIVSGGGKYSVDGYYNQYS